MFTIVKERDRFFSKEVRDFLNSQVKSTIYHDPIFLGIYDKTDNYEPYQFMAVDEAGKVKAFCIGANFSEKSGLMGYLTKRSLSKAGILYTDPASAAFCLKEINKDLKGKSIYIKLNSVYQDPAPIMKEMQAAGYFWEPWMNFEVALGENTEEVWGRISSTRKKQIKRSEKRGALIEVSHEAGDIDKIYELLKTTYSNAGVPLSGRDFFDNVINEFSKTKQVLFVKVKVNEELIAHRIILLHKTLMHDWYAGSNPSFHEYYPNDAAVWAALKWGCENGYSMFDFGGAGHPDRPYGVREFKRTYGGELVNFGTFIKVNKPLVYNAIQKVLEIRNKIKQKGR